MQIAKAFQLLKDLIANSAGQSVVMSAEKVEGMQLEGAEEKKWGKEHLSLAVDDMVWGAGLPGESVETVQV